MNPTELPDPEVVANDIIFQSTDMEHMRIRIKLELERCHRLLADRAASAAGDEPDIFADALASQIDAIRRAAFDEAIGIVKGVTALDYGGINKKNDIIEALKAARDQTEKPRSDKGKHHHIAGVLQEDVDEAEN